MPEPRVPATLSRRSALRAGAAGGAGIALALALPAAARAQTTGEAADDLAEAIEIAYGLAVGYEAAAGAATSQTDVATLARFEVQSRAHAATLINAFELSSGEDPPAQPGSIEESGRFEDLPADPSATELNEALIELEGEQITQLLVGLPDRDSASLVRTSAEIAANCAQHQAVLRQLAGAPVADVIPEAIVEPAPDTTSQPDESGS